MIARFVRILAVVIAAIVVGFAVASGAAILGHQFLVLKVGEEGIPAIDDTPLMFAVVACVYLAGGLAGLLVLVLGWMRFVRRRV